MCLGWNIPGNNYGKAKWNLRSMRDGSVSSNNSIDYKSGYRTSGLGVAGIHNGLRIG